MSFLRNISPKYFLLLILLMGFLLRFNNLTVGFPILYMSNDEAIYHLSALNMLATKSIFSIGNYGPLGSYAQIPFILLSFVVMFLSGKVHNIRDFEFLLVTQEGYLTFIPRVISALFGVLSVLVIYKLTVEIFESKKAALWASALFAISFNLVHVSHLARAWSPAIFFALLSVLFAYKSIKKHDSEFKNVTFAFIFSAISFGFHQISGMVIILIILLRLISSRNLFEKKVILTNLSALLLWAFLILVFNFLSVGGDFFKIVSPGNPNVGLIKLPHASDNLFDVLRFYINEGNVQKVFGDLIKTDGIIVGSAMLFFTKRTNWRREYLPFFLFIFLNFLLVVTVFPPFVRYFLISFSLLPIFSGFVLSRVLHLNFTSVIFASILLLLASLNSIYWNILILKTPTFSQVHEWVDKNIRSEVPIAYTIRRNFGHVPNARASAPIREFRPGFYSRAAELTGETYPPNVRNVVYINEFQTRSKEEDLQRASSVYPVKYVVDSYLGSYDRLLFNSSSFDFELIVHFSPTGEIVYNYKIPEAFFDAPYNFPLFLVDRPGPYFDVLKIK
ncbi:MAG: glycosyltransferase family 39 protein [Candidatus Curtissbacteria bacterium]|nr:glycosyltransferase family 39 protein [Candidatus Curtissbacteria bacterium]